MNGRIENVQEYRIAKDMLARLEQAMAAPMTRPHPDVRVQRMLRDSLVTERESLRSRIARYEHECTDQSALDQKPVKSGAALADAEIVPPLT